MYLWLLRKRPRRERPQFVKWQQDPWAYSVNRNHELVVRATSEMEARQIAENNAGEESKHVQVWLNSAYTTCDYINPMGPLGVICGLSKLVKTKDTERVSTKSTRRYKPPAEF